METGAPKSALALIAFDREYSCFHKVDFIKFNGVRFAHKFLKRGLSAPKPPKVFPDYQSEGVKTEQLIMNEIVPKQSSSQIATARWGDPSYISEQYPYFPGAIWLGRNPHNEHEAVGYHDDRHVFLCAGTRTGKGRAFIINNLLKWPGSIVSVDPKGENATIAAPRRGPGNEYCDGMGQDTYVLDPMRCADIPNELRAHYNLLDALDPEDGELLTKTNRIAEAICIVPESGESAEWAKRGREYISNIIAHVVTYTKNFKEKENRNLITARKLITEGEVEGAKRVKELLNIDMSSFDVLLDDMIDNTACKGRIASIARSLKKQAEDTPKYFESVRGEAVYQTSFLNSDGIEDTVCNTGRYPRSFDISALKNSSEGTSIFLCLPLDDADPYARWQRAMIAIILGEMQKKQGMPANGHQMLFSIDEFQSLGKMERTARAMNEIAGAGVKLMVGTQNLGGLQNLYKKNWETFLSGAGLQIWFGAEGPITKKHLQEELGQTEVVKIVSSINASKTRQSTKGKTEGHSHTDSTSRSETDSENWSESENSSESDNWNRGKNWSKSKNVNESDNWNRGKNWGHSKNFSESGNWNNGINWGDSENWGQSEGKQAGRNYGPHIFFKGWEHTDSIGSNSGSSTGKTKSKGGSSSQGGSTSHGKASNQGGSASHGGSKSHGKASSRGGSATYGGSRTHGRSSTRGGGRSTTTQTGKSDTHQSSEQTSSSKGYQIGGGIAQSFHKKPLLEVNEINEYLSSPKEVDHIAYPGMALVMISGELPFFVRKSNYDQDPEFVRCFNPNPAYGYIPLDKLPLLGYQYTKNYYLTVTISKEIRDYGYFAKPIEGLKKNRKVKSGEDIFEYKKEGSEWERITIPHDAKVMHIFEPGEQHETGHIMTLRFDFAMSDEDRKKMHDLFWEKPALEVERATRERERLEKAKLLKPIPSENPKTANFRKGARAIVVFKPEISIEDAWSSITEMFNPEYKGGSLMVSDYPLKPYAVLFPDKGPEEGDIYEYTTYNGTHFYITINRWEPNKRLAYTIRTFPQPNDKNQDAGASEVSFDKMEFLLGKTSGKAHLDVKRYEEAYVSFFQRMLGVYGAAESLVASIGGTYKKNKQPLKLPPVSCLEITEDNTYRPGF
ncbi:MAG: type IV secretory system conjugative DNA transfer family protein [Deltaproteobacteria bacterium]|nr:type IV secretory system conjugative DNA transfer family protein [Deltaproteobacteria bacterium]